MNDTIQYNKAIEGLLEVHDTILLYQSAEEVYLNPKEVWTINIDNYRNKILDLYKSILYYQVRAACYLSRNTALRMVRNIVQVDPWDVDLAKIKSETKLCQDHEEIIREATKQKGNCDLKATIAKGTEELLKAIHNPSGELTYITPRHNEAPRESDGLNLPVLFDCLGWRASVLMIELSGKTNDWELFDAIRRSLTERECYFWRSYSPFLLGCEKLTLYWVSWWEYATIEYCEVNNVLLSHTLSVWLTF